MCRAPYAKRHMGRSGRVARPGGEPTGHVRSCSRATRTPLLDPAGACPPRPAAAASPRAARPGRPSLIQPRHTATTTTGANPAPRRPHSKCGGLSATWAWASIPGQGVASRDRYGRSVPHAPDSNHGGERGATHPASVAASTASHGRGRPSPAKAPHSAPATRGASRVGASKVRPGSPPPRPRGERAPPASQRAWRRAQRHISGFMEPSKSTYSWTQIHRMAWHEA